MNPEDFSEGSFADEIISRLFGSGRVRERIWLRDQRQAQRNAQEFRDEIGTTDGFNNAVLDATAKARGYDSGYYDEHVREERRLLSAEQNLENKLALAALRRRLARGPADQIQQLRDALGAPPVPGLYYLEDGSSFATPAEIKKRADEAELAKEKARSVFYERVINSSNFELRDLVYGYRVIDREGNLTVPFNDLTDVQRTIYAEYYRRLAEGQFAPGVVPITQVPSVITVPGQIAGAPQTTTSNGDTGQSTTKQPGNLVPPDSGGTGQIPTPYPGLPNGFPDEFFRRNPADP